MRERLELFRVICEEYDNTPASTDYTGLQRNIRGQMANHYPLSGKYLSASILCSPGG
jgi:hypothetical protein